MIISKTPYRVSLFGGSTDYESFYGNYGSLLVGFGLNQYQYVTVHNLPHGSKNFIEFHGNEAVEKVGEISQLKNRAVRGTLEYMDWQTPLYISTNGDVQTQTGLGSSSSFIVGLLKALDRLKGVKTNKQNLTTDAIFIERVQLEEVGGIQDQIWAVYGGFNSISINTNGKFTIRPLPLSKKFLDCFKKHSVLIYTGQQRDSFNIAESHNNPDSIGHKEDIFRIASLATNAFFQEDLEKISHLLCHSWESKKAISPLISSTYIDILCNKATKCGASAVKLLGCGKDGFLFCLLNSGISKDNFIHEMNMSHIDIDFDFRGSRIILD